MPVIISNAHDSDMPDFHVSSNWYATRFSGKTGRWFLRVQEEALLEALREWPAPASVLDVGGGHGQLAGILVRQGYDVTVLGGEAARRERIAPLVESGACRFQVGSFERLPFPDGAFDLVVSFRIMPHIKDWQGFLSELKRVAKKAFVIDYATTRSVNCLAKQLFGFKRRIEGKITGFIIYNENDLLSYCRSIELTLKYRFPQYFLPMAFHRLLKCSKVSEKLERFFRHAGMTSGFGSPVITCFTLPADEKA